MKYEKDINYFSCIDTAKKAYILGFIYADGYNRQNLLELVQNESRLDILHKIRKELKSNAPIKEVVPGKYMLNICSSKMCEDLSDLGAVRAKSLLLRFPTCIDQPLIRHFIRGYFDGDGCVWVGKRKEYLTKVKTGQYRFKTVQNVKFTFTGNTQFISGLQNWLVDNIGLSKTKLNFSKAKETKHICTMEYSGRNNLRKIYDLMYKDATIYCNEKYNKFNQIFCASLEKSNEDTSLIAGTPEMVISSQASLEEGSSTIPEMGVELSSSKREAPNLQKKGEDIVSSTTK